jgi:hypothetical protein
VCGCVAFLQKAVAGRGRFDRFCRGVRGLVKRARSFPITRNASSRAAAISSLAPIALSMAAEGSVGQHRRYAQDYSALLTTFARFQSTDAPAAGIFGQRDRRDNADR